MRDNLYPDGDLRHLVAEDGEALEGDRPIYILCPYHEDKHRPSLAVYPNSAYCFTCRTYIPRDAFLALFPDAEKAAAFFTASRRPHKPSKPTVKPWVAMMSAHDRLMRMQESPEWGWLEQRGIQFEQVFEYLLGHNGVAFSLPIFDEKDDVVTVRYRRDDAAAPHLDKYWGLRGANQTLLFPHPPKEERIVLTEGEFDALLLRRYGLPAYSFTNGAQSMHKPEVIRERLAGVKHVTVVFDTDAPGRESSEKLLKLLEELGVTSVVVGWTPFIGKDVTELWQRNPELFQKIVTNIKHYVALEEVG